MARQMALQLALKLVCNQTEVEQWEAPATTGG
jgi:hypothetical protein